MALLERALTLSAGWDRRHIGDYLRSGHGPAPAVKAARADPVGYPFICFVFLWFGLGSADSQAAENALEGQSGAFAS